MILLSQASVERVDVIFVRYDYIPIKILELKCKEQITKQVLILRPLAKIIPD